MTFTVASRGQAFDDLDSAITPLNLLFDSPSFDTVFSHIIKNTEFPLALGKCKRWRPRNDEHQEVKSGWYLLPPSGWQGRNIKEPGVIVPEDTFKETRNTLYYSH